MEELPRRGHWRCYWVNVTQFITILLYKSVQVTVLLSVSWGLFLSFSFDYLCIYERIMGFFCKIVLHPTYVLRVSVNDERKWGLRGLEIDLVVDQFHGWTCRLCIANVLSCCHLFRITLVTSLLFCDDCLPPLSDNFMSLWLFNVILWLLDSCGSMDCGTFQCLGRVWFCSSVVLFDEIGLLVCVGGKRCWSIARTSVPLLDLLLARLAQLQTSLATLQRQGWYAGLICGIPSVWITVTA